MRLFVFGATFVQTFVRLRAASTLPMTPNMVCFGFIDEGQITHLISARLKYDLYDFFRWCFGPVSCFFLVEKAQKHPLKKSYRSYFRRAQIR